MSQAVDVDLNPSPLPRPRRGGLPIFLQPEEDTELSPPSSTESLSDTRTPSPSLDEGIPSDSGWPDEPAESDRTGTSSTASSAGSRLGKAATRATAAKAVLIAGGVAHRVAARTELEQAAGLWATDAEDAENIGHPLGDIVSRRGGVAGKALSPDAADAVSALMGLANYVSKQVAVLLSIRQHEAAQVVQTVPAPVDL